MKKRLLCSALPKSGSPVILSEDEGHHATRVLRLRDGDIIEAMDGKGNHAFTVLRTRGGTTRLEHLTQEELRASSLTTQTSDVVLPIGLEIAILKGDAMEWVVEKCVELGIQRLTPLMTAHTVVQIKNKGSEFFQTRWQKIADQALKQCGRLSRLEIDPPTPLEDLFIKGGGSGAPRLWCDENSDESSIRLMDWLSEHPRLDSLKILVGPEGGWSAAEREFLLRETGRKTAERISLGSATLRAETAALFAMSVGAAHLMRRN